MNEQRNESIMEKYEWPASTSPGKRKMSEQFNGRIYRERDGKRRSGGKEGREHGIK